MPPLPLHPAAPPAPFRQTLGAVPASLPQLAKALLARRPDWQLARRTRTAPGHSRVGGSPEVVADRWRSWPHVDSSVTSESSLRLTLHLLSSCFPEISNDKQSQNRSHMSPNACGSAPVMLFQLSLVLNATANTACSSHTHPGRVSSRLSGSSFPEPHGPSRPCPTQPLHPCPTAAESPLASRLTPALGRLLSQDRMYLFSCSLECPSTRWGFLNPIHPKLGPAQGGWAAMTAAQGLVPTPISLKSVFLQHWRVCMRAPAFLNLEILTKF